MKTPTFHRLKKSVGLAVLKKYKYICQSCGDSKRLCVHHIERKTIGSYDYNDINNLTVLCRSCHMRLHRKAGHILTIGTGSRGFYGGRRGYSPPIFCKYKNCGKPQHAQGYCHTHYEYKRKHGTLLL